MAGTAGDGDAVFDDFLAQGVAIHAQELSGLNLVPIRFTKRMLDQWSFHRLDEGSVQTPGRTRLHGPNKLTELQLDVIFESQIPEFLQSAIDFPPITFAEEPFHGVQSLRNGRWP